MNAIEGLWGVARGLGEKGLSGVKVRRERTASESEALSRLLALEAVLQRVREGSEAAAPRTSSQASLDVARSAPLFGQVLARFHQRRRGLSGWARALKWPARIGAALWTARAGHLLGL